ncbi:hypothetical protein D3C75_959070 [compost metagenome]
MGEFLAFAHVPGYHHQYRRHAGQRNMGGIGGEQHQHQKHRQAVEHTRKRGNSAVADIGGRPGNRTGSRDAAEQRRNHIGNTLPDQLPVAVMAVTAHAVSHHGRQQGFDAAQHGND